MAKATKRVEKPLTEIQIEWLLILDTGKEVEVHAPDSALRGLARRKLVSMRHLTGPWYIIRLTRAAEKLLDEAA